MGKKIYLIILVLFVFAQVVDAQTKETKNIVFGFFFIMPIEFPDIKTSFDEQLMKYNFPKANYPIANIGLGLQLYSNQFIGGF